MTPQIAWLPSMCSFNEHNTALIPIKQLTWDAF